jgi:tetratricopeptide (TPR) repeat protein
VARRKPQIVVLRADTGLGKTRLVQDFYRLLSSTADPDGYWPDVLPDVHKAMTIVPTLPNRTLRETPALPWLWLALRCRDPGERNRDARGDIAFDVVRRQLQMHLPGLYRAELARSGNAKLAKSAVSIVASFAVPGGGPALAVLEQAIGAASDALGAWDALDAVRGRLGARPREREDPVALALEAEKTSLADGAMRAMRALAAHRPGSLAVPIILVVDDGHWADPTTIDVLDALVRAAWREGWPLLTVITAWDETLKVDERASSDKTMADFLARLGSGRLLEQGPLPQVHSLRPLDIQRLCQLVADRLPNLGREAREVLAVRCSGDLDLLFDFVDELEDAPGWLDAGGRLACDVADLDDLPSQAADMARRRLRTIGAPIVQALSLASAQGPEFHELLVRKIAAAVGEADELETHLDASDVEHGVTELRPHAQLLRSGEFRRHVYWEVSEEHLSRPAVRRRAVLRALAEVLRETIESAIWDELPRRDRAQLGARLLELIDVLGLDGESWLDARDRLELELAAARLDLGDAYGAVRLAEAYLARSEDAPPQRAQAYRLLVEAAYMLGDVETERRRLDAWRESEGDRDPQLLCWTAAFALRQSAPGPAVVAAQRAVDNTPAGSRLHVVAATTLSRALWSAGQAKEALTALDACEREEHAILASDPEARVAVDHAAALALHDLERNLRVVDHAQRAVNAYRAAGRIEAQLIMSVNLGDGLWGAGRLADARTMLEDVQMHAEAAGLPHAQDIAAMCLANVLAATGDHDRALELYGAGVELADRIGHDWDAIYGRVYQALSVAEAHQRAVPQELLSLSDRARDAGYDYLRSLAVAYAPLVAYAAGDTERAQWALGLASERHEQAELAYGPAAHLCSLEVLLASVPSRTEATRFVVALGRCEGLKGRPHLVLQAIQRLRELSLLDLVQAEFATRWQARFSPEALEPPPGDGLQLRVCDHRACEARCCYDGVYLKEGEPERINAAVASDPEFFAHLPEHFIVHGDWDGTSGPKTAVRSHGFHSPDFPDHFNQTRCVFAFADGACSLQAFAAKQGEDPWTYKPHGCWMHPLRTVDGVPTPPASALERDRHFLGQRYPGYTAYTPCGQERSDGRPWTQTLRSEIRRAAHDLRTPST